MQSVRSAQDLATRAPWHAAPEIASPASRHRPRPALTGKNYRAADTFSAGTNACLEVGTLPRQGLEKFVCRRTPPNWGGERGVQRIPGRSPCKLPCPGGSFMFQKSSELYKWNSEKVNTGDWGEGGDDDPRAARLRP